MAILSDLSRDARGRNKGKCLGKFAMYLYEHLDTQPKTVDVLIATTRFGPTAVWRGIGRLLRVELAERLTLRVPHRRGRPRSGWIIGPRTIGEVEIALGARDVGDQMRARIARERATYWGVRRTYAAQQKRLSQPHRRTEGTRRRRQRRWRCG